jgi:hypothetical protein
METRVTDTTAAFAFIWSLLSFFSLLGNLRYIPLHLTILTALLGVVVGAVSGFAVTKRQLNFLTKNGETRVRFSTILFLIGGLLILFSLTYFFVINAQIVTLGTVNNFAFPTLSAYFVSEAIVFLRWERKHRKLIFASGWSRRLYASPKTD